MMRQHLRTAALTTGFAAMLATGVAHADVYTWTDESGMLNVSNLTPPEGAKIAKVVKESPRATPPPSAPPPDAAPPIEFQTLALRVRQLEYEVELARRQPPPMDYAAYAPPPMQYAPPMMQYSAEPPPQPGYGCDSAWNGCFGAWGLGYPATVVVLDSPGFRRHGPIRRPHPLGMQRTMGPPAGGGATVPPWGGGIGAPWGGATTRPPGAGAAMNLSAAGGSRHR
jgi:hypothetical protein